MESLSSESSSHTANAEPLEPPAVPKSSSDPAVHVPGTPGTSGKSGNNVTPSANSSLSSSGELGQPSGEQMPQARTKGSAGTHSTKPFSGATPTPFLLAGDRNPAPPVGSASPQLQIKVSAPGVPEAAFLPALWVHVSSQGKNAQLQPEWHTHHYLWDTEPCVSSPSARHPYIPHLPLHSLASLIPRLGHVACCPLREPSVHEESGVSLL